jgi:hypothetical protein
MERRERFEELCLLRAWGVELCLTIIGSSQVKSPLPAKMRATTLRHAVVVRELTALWVALSSVAEHMLERSPDETSRVEVMNKLAAKFWRLEELCSRPEGPGKRIYNLLLRPPPGQARWANCLEEAVRRLEMAMAEQR